MQLTEQVILMEKNERTLKAGDDKSLSVRFKLMSAETENLNKRIYPLEVLAKAVEGLKARITKRRDSFASAGHKDDPQVDDATAYLEDVTMEGNDVIATARVIATQKGKNIITLLKHGAALGVSARGRGSMDGNRVKPGFELLGFDWTLNPGFGTYASAANIVESVTVGEDDGSVSLAQLEEMGLIEEPKKELTEADLKARYYAAIQAGFAGDFAAYQAAMDKPAADIRAEIEYELAKKDSGFKGSLDQHRAVHLTKK